MMIMIISFFTYNDDRNGGTGGAGGDNQQPIHSAVMCRLNQMTN